MYVKVDLKQLRFDERLAAIKAATKAGTKIVASEYRDELKKNFIESSQGSKYNAVSPIQVGGKGSISNHLVVSGGKGNEAFTIGPKKGGMATQGGSSSNFKTYEQIFEYNEYGTLKSDPWTFQLKDGRNKASPDGYWTTYGMAPKKFAEKTLKEYQSGKLQLSTNLKIKPLLGGVLD